MWGGEREGVACGGVRGRVGEGGGAVACGGVRGRVWRVGG